MENIQSNIKILNTNQQIGEIETDKINCNPIVSSKVVEIPKINNQIKDYIYNKYPSDFKDILINDFELLENTDLIVSGKVQIGKTSVIITSSWISLYCRNEIPIIISWDLISVMNQTLSRMSHFDNDLRLKFNDNNYLLNTQIIPTNIDNNYINAIIENKYCLITILQPGRLESIERIIKAGSERGLKFRIIIDESDQAIKSEMTITEGKMMSSFLAEKYKNTLSIMYVSATNFTVYNSLNRFSHRKYRVVSIPNNIYEKNGLEYRSHNSFIKYPTDYLIGLEKPEMLTVTQWSNVINLLKCDFTTNSSERRQPNIGLLDVSYKNDPKHTLAKTISYYIPDIYVVVYISPCTIVYKRNMVHYKFQEGLCIGDVLDIFQRSEYFDQTKNILIISTGLAGRAQTFKTTDNKWVLTHHFFNKKTLSVDSLIQALRGCGQYKTTDPVVKFYSSNRIIKSLETSWMNNDNLTEKIYRHQSSYSMRSIIEQISFISNDKPIKFTSRKNISDLQIKRADSDYSAISATRDNIFKKAEILRHLNNCDGIVEVASYHWIPITVYTGILNRSKCRELAKIQLENMRSQQPYKGMNPSLQTCLRNSIMETIKSMYGIKIDQCQLCYNDDREKNLNKLHHLKTHFNYKCQIIALHPKNVNYIPFVLYNSNYLDAFSDMKNPDPQKIYTNKVLIWPGTDGQYRCYVNNSAESKIRMFQVSH
jgi:hypothetical protein